MSWNLGDPSKAAPEVVSAVKAELDDSQYKALASDESLSGGNLIVTACPGSGKTRSVGARVALQLAQERRIALASYTNVGAREIWDASARMGVFDASGMAFCGTLHRLFLRYVLRPWGHLHMGCTIVPQVRRGRSMDQVEVCGHSFYVDDFRYLADGSFSFSGWRPRDCYRKNTEIAQLGERQVREAKRRQAQSGIITADDAAFWTLSTLREFSHAASAVAARFDEIIVDEAQDTSDVLGACLEELAKTCTLKSLVLVGDFSQSIYSFQGASPKVVDRIVQAQGLKQVRLDRNYRSSAAICGVLGRIRRDEPDEAAGPDRDCLERPRLVIYRRGAAADVVQYFEKRLNESGLTKADAVIVARTRRVVSELSGKEDIPDGRFSALNVLLDAMGPGVVQPDFRALRGVEDLLREWCVSALMGNSRVDPLDPLDLRVETINLCDSAPTSGCTFDEWSRRVADVASRSVARLTGVGDFSVSSIVEVPQDLKARLVDSSGPAQGGQGFRFETVHGVKGESVGGIMLVGEGAARYNRPLDHIAWASAVNGGFELTAEDAEEARVLYVALSRARRVCDVAVPDIASPDSVRKFQQADFEVVRLGE